MVCKKCGIELGEGGQFCPVCGQYNEDESVILQRASNLKYAQDKKKMILASIFGGLGLIAWYIPLFGYPIGVLGIVFGSKAIKTKSFKAIGIIALILGILCIVASAINSILGMMMMLEQMQGAM